MHPKLIWVSKFTRSLSLAMPGISHSIQDTVDPLKKLIVLNLGESLAKGDYKSVRTIAHAFAKVNDCTIQRIRKGPKSLTIEILTKTRLGEKMNNSPFEEIRVGPRR